MGCFLYVAGCYLYVARCFLYVAGYFCMSQDTFVVTHVAVCEHENEVEWLGT